MKKLLVIILLSSFVLASCGGGDGNTGIGSSTGGSTSGGSYTGLNPNTCITEPTGEPASDAQISPSVVLADYYFDAGSIKEINRDHVDIDWFISDYDYSKLYRSCSESGPYYQVGGNLTHTNYRDTGLAPFTRYFYKLRACTLTGCSQLSDAVKVVSASASQSDNKDFESSKAIVLDKIYYRTLFGGSTISSIGKEFFSLDLHEAGILKVKKEDYTTDHVGCYLYNPNKTELFVGDCNDLSVIVTPGKYFIKVEGVYTYTSGAYTLMARLITSTPSPSAEQFNQSHLKVQGDYVEIRWLDMGEDITHYEVYGSESENGTFLKLEPYFIPSRPYYLGQKPTYIYYYKIKACNESGCSGFSVNTLKAEG